MKRILGLFFVLNLGFASLAVAATSVSDCINSIPFATDPTTLALMQACINGIATTAGVSGSSSSASDGASLGVTTDASGNIVAAGSSSSAAANPNALAAALAQYTGASAASTDPSATIALAVQMAQSIQNLQSEISQDNQNLRLAGILTSLNNGSTAGALATAQVQVQLSYHQQQLAQMQQLAGYVANSNGALSSSDISFITAVMQNQTSASSVGDPATLLATLASLSGGNGTPATSDQNSLAQYLATLQSTAH